MISTEAPFSKAWLPAYILTDSRQLAFASETLFVAIKGERHDGHLYIEELYQKGVRKFIVEQKALDEKIERKIEAIKDATFWVVENSVLALQQLTIKKRQQFDNEVIGITGSNGKTIIKEWLAQLLSPDYNIAKSPKSYNSQIGVPLSVWQLNENHTLGIFEAGLSKPHEMENLEPIIRPTIGIFTNIGTAHDEGFKSQKQKITEKLKLFAHCQKLIYCSDYEEIETEINIILKAVNPNCQFVGWGKNGKWKVEFRYEYAQICLSSISTHSTFDIQHSTLTTPASLENLTHCIVLMLEMGIAPAIIQERISQLRPVSMRLELKRGINNCYLIDDTYNNDLVGLTMALNFLSQQSQRANKVLILSDLLEIKQKQDEVYTHIAELVKNKGITQLIGVGKNIKQNKAKFSELYYHFYESTSEFLEQFDTSALHDSVVLIKGARVFQFENIVQHLLQKTHGTVLKINLNAITHNLNFYKSVVGKETKIMAMVKAFAYGGGSSEIAQLLQFHRVEYLSVAYTDEGIQLRNDGITLPIMVMNPSAEAIDKMVANNLEPEIYSFKILNELIKKVRTETKIKIHLKLDTGMHRLGFIESDLEELINILSSNKNIEIATIFSHLVGADEAIHTEFTKLQYAKFIEWSDRLILVLKYSPIRHILNSAGIVRFPEYKLDMVRLGIGLYGVEVSGIEPSKLKSVGTLKTIISQIKTLEAGDSVGYGRNQILDRNSKIATIAIGYADGFDRRFGNGVSKVSVNGVLCKTVGNICMDMCMIDVSATNAQEGDEVIVFGENISISTLATLIGTIPYEILTGISERVKRVFYRDDD